MKTLIKKFPNQLREAIHFGEEAKLSKPKKISNVFIAGLGGSGIGGTIVSELVAMEATVPITVGKGYFIPKFVNQNTLVIISSYSGDTEETLNCLHLALKRKAKIICITSGGKVAEIAKKKKLDLILIPGGNPPRACLGYSLTQQFFILSHFGIISNKFKAQLKSAIELIETEKANIISEAKQVAEKIHGKTPIVYTTTYFEGVAIRFRQQLNENSKILCGHHVIPEMNHNELVGWASGSERVSVIILRDKDEYARNNVRIEINKEVIKKYTPYITEVWSKGKSQIEKAIYFIHLIDWASVLLSEIKGVDAMEIKVIEHLKGHLSKI
ncbi:MAG: bifunctional phosphoglucose/phosphomannose isomerase [Bacteroidetes bacterium]|nr:bifunctional phosphoglucose/phosphomannose isomerase [Bacteroidota bacterium]